MVFAEIKIGQMQYIRVLVNILILEKVEEIIVGKIFSKKRLIKRIHFSWFK